MTVIEIKTEIKKAVDEMPEDALIDILDYIKGMQNLTEEDIKADKDVQAILSENHELLKRLAQ